MKKSILFLINGYGVEQYDSVEIYSKELMPCLDNIISSNYLIRLPNTFLDYRAAYRKFSMGIDRDLSHSLIEKNILNVEYPENQLLKYITNETVRNDSNLHMIVYVDSPSVFDELSVYIKDIYLKVKNKIIVHFILSQKSILDYKDIEKGLINFNYDMGSNIKIGIVSGEANLYDLSSSKEFVKSLLTETGEKWKDFSKKLNVFVNTKVIPYRARTFAINYGYRLEEKDQILFFNYSNVNVNLIIKEIEEQKYRKMDFSTLSYYSLFPVKCDRKIPFMYNYALASTCFFNSLNAINARCLILDKKDNCPVINYYLTGLRNTIDDKLKYVATDDGFIYDPVKLEAALKTYDKDIIIINYQIDDTKTVDELKEKLTVIDKAIDVVYNYSITNNYALYISSLYGMNVEMYNKKAELCKVNLFSKVPFIFVNTDFSTSDYNVIEGNLFDVSNTLLYTFNNEFPNGGLLKRKTKLFSFLYKKPKASERIEYTNINKKDDSTENNNQ